MALLTAETPLRGRFDFRVAATSFLVPADWETNVRAVGHLVDEIELLFFDSRPAESLPTPAVVAGLAAVAAETGVTYNIHLPSDLSPGHEDPAVRDQALSVLEQVIGTTAALHPSAYTLHLPYDGPDRLPPTVRSWQHRVRGFTTALLEAVAASTPPQAVTIENLDYPPAWAWDAVSSMDVGFCLDIGHLMLHGEDPGDIFNRYGENIRLIHLHGVDGERDHLPLTVLDASRRQAVVDILKRFTGTVSIEVFRRRDFWESVGWLSAALPQS